jgi:hypothetical protein
MIKYEVLLFFHITAQNNTAGQPNFIGSIAAGGINICLTV